MSEQRFPIFGPSVPAMLGRSKIIQRLWGDLTKATPSNLSLIGPRFVGKTVIVNALAMMAACKDSPYGFVLHWHLGHVAPGSDEEFVAQLCDRLRTALVASGDDYAEHREYLGFQSFACLREVTDELNSDGKAILMLWDGFDKPLCQGKLSAQLWDQMRTIFYGKRHKIVTATRGPLSKLIRSQDVITSPFWNIFDVNSVRVGPFNDIDREDIIGQLPHHNFEPGARTELLNWSSGFPPLFLALLNHVIAEKPYGSINNEDVNLAAPPAIHEVSAIISDLWNDCPTGAKDVYSHLMGRGDLLLSDVGRDERDCLIEKGFVRQVGNKLTCACRMLGQHVRDTGPAAGSIARLFGTGEDYEANIRGLLERRLAHMSRFDDHLHHLLALAIADIPKYPEYCLNNLTHIEERALDLIWQREFGEAKTIPQETIDHWERVNPSDKTNQRLRDQLGNAVPGDRGLQVGILQLLTGSKAGFESKSKYVTKDTYVLINAIHSFRNRNQHSDGQDMHVGVAVAAIMLCLELLACLERELGS